MIFKNNSKGCLLATIGSKYEDGQLIERAVVPINKNLWSVSFVFVLVWILNFCISRRCEKLKSQYKIRIEGSLGYLMLLILFFVCDYFEIWNGTPFYYMGRNSILIYLLHTICDGIPWDWECEVRYFFATGQDLQPWTDFKL